MKKYIDISMPIREGMLRWPTDPKVRISAFKDQSSGKSSNVSLLEMGTHTGTHIDPPLHFLAGAASVDELPLEVLIGPARVIEVDAEEAIGIADLEGLDLTGVARILFKTTNSDLYLKDEFNRDYVYLSGDGADYLVEKKIRLVGIDYLSIDGFGDRAAPAHHRLLSSGTVILESIDMSAVEPGDYQLICLPLRIENGNGGPARVVLVRE